MDDRPPAPSVPTPRVPIIRGERVWLRPAERSDIPTFVRWFNDAEATHFLMQRTPMSLAGEEQWFERMLQQQGREHYLFVICLLEDGLPIGTIGLHDVDHLNGNAEFGIVIGEKDLWGQGLGTDALNAIVDFGFGELRLERIQLECYAFNPRGRRSYEKAGFTLEGTRRRAHYQNGEYHDVLLMALLRDEWRANPRRKGWQYADDPGSA